VAIGLLLRHCHGSDVVLVQRKHTIKAIGRRRQAEGRGTEKCEQGKQAFHGFSLGMNYWLTV
jgi:hypothetical protein